MPGGDASVFNFNLHDQRGSSLAREERGLDFSIENNSRACLFVFFFLAYGGKIILLKVSRGFSGPGHPQQTWHKAEVPQMGAGGCCLHPASPFLPIRGKVSSKFPSCFSLKQERFPGHCPELNSLGSDQKSPVWAPILFTTQACYP